MKIGLIARFFDLSNGGIGRFSVHMLEGLKKRGYEIAPVSTKRKSSIGHIIYSGIEMPFKIPRGCDIYHCLTPLEAIYAPKSLSVVTYHDLIPWLHLRSTDTHYAQGWMKVIKNLGSKYVFKTAAEIASRCRGIACNSEFTKRELVEHLGIDESVIRVIRFGINNSLEPRLKNSGVFRIGTLSYLDQRKRIDILIKAFLAADIDAELVIGGKGNDYSRLKRLAGNDKRIKFTGFIPEEKLTDFYNAMDLFVFTTKIEGYGLPIVEAFACKKPVVLLSDAIVTDEIRERCLIVDNLADFLRSPKISMDIEANYLFAKLHDWDNCVEEYIRLYRDVLEHK
jgi:glycosyltransferase involved in cell wall biosynthesis